MEQQIQEPPYNPLDQITAAALVEQNLLCCILMDQTLIEEARASLRKEMFGHPYHRNLFRMFCELHEARILIDPTNIFTRYEKHMDKIGGFAYLANLVGNDYANPKQFSNNIQTMVEGFARHNALSLLNEFRTRFEDPSLGSFEVLLNEFERASLEIRPRRILQESGVKSVVEWFEKFILKTQDSSRAFGLLTGWKDLDRILLGLQRAELIVIGARTSMGKSAFAIEIAVRVSRAGWRVAIFSLEMITDQLYNRMMGSMAMVSAQAMRVGNVHQGQIDAISSHLHAVSQIHIDDERGVTAEYIVSEMRRLKRQEGLDLVIIDYLQEIKEPSEKNDNAGSALHRVCQTIRTAAKDCDCAVVGLSQVKREVEQRANKRPMTSDLSGSAAIEAVADTIIMLYRDEYYNVDSEAKGILEVNVAKQRNGPTGLVKMNYDKNYQRITGKGDDPYGVNQESLALV